MGKELKMARLVAIASLPGLLSVALLGTSDSGVQAGEWLPVPEQSLAIEPGNPLDFSALVPNAFAGSAGPLTLASGALYFPDGGRSARFNCAVLANGPNGTWDLPTHAEADELADQFRRHGYDLVRFHYLDARLMRHATRDFQVDANDLDRFHYLLAALKKRGIYWMLDVQTAYDSGIAGSLNNKLSPNSLKIRLNFDPVARAHWAKLLDTLYATINPYTGVTPLADPALAFVVGANENSLAFGSLSDPAAFPNGLAPLYDRWLRRRFPAPDSLPAALPDMTIAERSGSPIALPASWKGTGPRLSLFLRFVADQEVDTYRWMGAQLAKRGFRGPLLGYPEWYRQATGETRARLPITDIHAYLGELTSYSAGAELKLPSSTSDAGLGNWTTNAGARWLDRPMVATEYGVPIPNPYRYEGGIVYPAIAALQGYSAICRMADMAAEPAIPAAQNARGMLGYSVGLDPTSRAAETLATFLFYRGDVHPAQATVAVPFADREFEQPGSAFLPAGIRRAALLARFGLIAPDRVATLPPPVRILPLTANAYGYVGKLLDWLTDMTNGALSSQLIKLTGDLRKNGTLPAGNRTDAASGIYQSGTGELTVDQPNGRLTIVTPRSEAISVTAASGAITLGQLTMRSLDSGALVAANSLDGHPLAESRKILLILAGDTMNSGMRLDGTGINRRMVDWGRLPILMRRVRTRIVLKSSVPGSVRLSVLSLRGSIVRSRPVEVAADNTASITLDTGAIPANPTTFFLLERGTVSSIDSAIR
jgi:hypothetical protein